MPCLQICTSPRSFFSGVLWHSCATNIQLLCSGGLRSLPKLLCHFTTRERHLVTTGASLNFIFHFPQFRLLGHFAIQKSSRAGPYLVFRQQRKFQVLRHLYSLVKSIQESKRAKGPWEIYPLNSLSSRHGELAPLHWLKDRFYGFVFSPVFEVGTNQFPGVGGMGRFGFSACCPASFEVFPPPTAEKEEFISWDGRPPACGET